MTASESSLKSPRRLAALQSSGLIDSPAVPAFDRLTKLATVALRVPVALISIVDNHRQFFKSECGLPEPWATQRETPLSYSFCQHVVVSAEPLLITDARIHELVRENLAVRDIGVVAYAGVPIRDDEGNVLGSMCAIDTKPREWSQQDVELLEALSAQVTVEIALINKSVDLADDLSRHRERETHRQSTARLNVHDLRTPLSALVLGLDIIKRVGPINTQQATYLELCKRNTVAVLGMVHDLLDISGLDLQGKTGLRCSDCEPRELIDAAVEQVHALAADKAIHLTVLCAEGLHGLRSDKDKLTRVLVNLLANAIKFTHESGRVVVDARRDPAMPETAVQFTVTDDGIGMGDTRHIFGEGVTLNQVGSASGSRGFGLGLAFCERVVLAHGGKIWVASTPGQGSAFYVSIPVTTAD